MTTLQRERVALRPSPHILSSMYTSRTSGLYAVISTLRFSLGDRCFFPLPNRRPSSPAARARACARTGAHPTRAALDDARGGHEGDAEDREAHDAHAAQGPQDGPHAYRPRRQQRLHDRRGHSREPREDVVGNQGGHGQLQLLRLGHAGTPTRRAVATGRTPRLGAGWRVDPGAGLANRSRALSRPVGAATGDRRARHGRQPSRALSSRRGRGQWRAAD